MSAEAVGITLRSQISKELRSKANNFLNSRRYSNNLVDIIASLEESIEHKLPLTPAILTLEVIFGTLFKRREMYVEIKPLQPKDNSPETKYREWLLQRYNEALNLILNIIESDKTNEAVQALVTSMKLLAAEGKYPLEKADIPTFPYQRLLNILRRVLSPYKSQMAIIQRFKEYSEFLDIVFYCWKLLRSFATRTSFTNEKFAHNFLGFVNILPVSKILYEERNLLCTLEDPSPEYCDYSILRRYINRVWNLTMQCTNGMTVSVHKQLLIVLLECVLSHLEKPILLTDFLMDSLDCGGSVSLLALQGIFTLIHKHNVTYPNIYEKLYSMFEPEIFHTKFKARLFYLADIFLSSTYLPESLVAAFVKRLARLSLVAPPQDIVIILYFIGNLILRHPGLKRLYCAQVAVEVSRDPFIMDEREPTKSNALDSSLWEIMLLQKHAIPSIATTAKCISQPTTEWDLSSVLEIKDDDIFDQEIAKRTKQYALAFERPNSLFLNKNDKVVQYWKLY